MNNSKNRVAGSENKQNLMKRDKQTIRFLKWIRQYSGWWYLICTPDDEHMTLEMMKMLITRLAKEQFYEIIFVLLTVHRNSIDSTLKYLLLDMIIAGWKGEVKDKDQFIKDITDLLT